MKKCQWCKIELSLKQIKQKEQRFCGKSCSAKWRMSRPEAKNMYYSQTRSQKISMAQKERHRRNPQHAKQSSLRMKKNNPSTRPEIITKIKSHWKKYGHPLSRIQMKGGNGRPTPKAQRTLYAALGLGWKNEWPIKTKQPRNSEYPTCYKVDIANPTKKIWIEVDGWSHTIPSIKTKDRKKEKLLKKLGWKGLRFSNQEIMKNLPRVLSKITQFITLK